MSKVGVLYGLILLAVVGCSTQHFRHQTMSQAEADQVSQTCLRDAELTVPQGLALRTVLVRDQWRQCVQAHGFVREAL